MITTLQVVVFDLDGVLFDTERLYMQATAAALAEMHITPPPHFSMSLIGASDDECDARLLDLLGEPAVYRMYRTLYQHHRDSLLTDGVPIKEGATEALDAAVALGLKLATGTNGSRSTATRHLSDTGLQTRFDCIVAREDVIHPKPAPDIFEMIAQRLSVPPSACLALEDSACGIRAGAAAGVSVLGVLDLAPLDTDILALCDGVVTDLHAAVAFMRRAAGQGDPA